LAPLASLSLAGQEHGRTIPLADEMPIARYGLHSTQSGIFVGHPNEIGRRNATKQDNVAMARSAFRGSEHSSW